QLGTTAGEFAIRARTQRQQILRRFARNKRAMASLILFALIVATAFSYPHFYRWSFDDQDLAHTSRPPFSPGHILGTQDIGRDLLALLMREIQRTTLIALLFVLIAGILGLLIGAIAGYYGRFIDNVLMRFVDLILTIPQIVVLIVVAS